MFFFRFLLILLFLSSLKYFTTSPSSNRVDDTFILSFFLVFFIAGKKIEFDVNSFGKRIEYESVEIDFHFFFPNETNAVSLRV